MVLALAGIACASQNEVPVVNAGPELRVTLGVAITLNATVTDDGLPNPPAAVTTTWTKQSGPGTVTFGNPSSVDTTANFSAAGTYILRLTANDSALSSYDEITVTVQTGNIYYVATNGNNGNPGTIGSPWRDIQYAVDNANVTAGCTVFVRGGVYNEQVAFNKSGSDAGGYIILRNYAAEAAILDGEGTNKIGIPALITISNQHHIFVCGLELRNLVVTGKNDTPAGIYVWDASYNIALCGNNIHNIENGALSGNAHGIAFYGRTSTAMTNILVEDNIISNCVLGTSESLVLNSNIDGFVVKDNIVHDNDNIGIDFIGFEGYGSPDQARNGSCIRNTVYNINFANNTNYQGIKNADGIYVDGGTNIIIERNTVHNCNLGIEVASEHSGHTTNYITVRSNTIYNSDVAGLLFGGYDSSVGAAANCNFINNTLYNNNLDNEGWGGEIVMQWYCTNNVVKNNTVYAAAGRRLINNENTSGSNNVYDYNLYYGSGCTWMWRNVLYSTFSDYKTGSGQDSHSLNTDPLFADAANLDLHIQSSSPCVDAGDPSLDYTGLKDIDGQARKMDNNADIGSDEKLGTPINQPPAVNAGSDQQIALPAVVNLDGTVTDDGLPNPPGAVTVTWTKQSGPGTVTFGNIHAVDTTASFSTTGVYVLRLTADDSALQSYDEVTITVNPPSSTIFYSADAKDGYVIETTETSGVGGTYKTTTTYIGDSSSRQQYIGFLHFDTSSIPDGATITGATISIRRLGKGGDPTSLGTITVDIKNGYYGTSDALRGEDFAAASSATNVATIPYPTSNGQWVSGDLNSSGRSNINKTGVTQFKVRFTTDDDNDSTADYLNIYDSGAPPKLEVTWQ